MFLMMMQAFHQWIIRLSGIISMFLNCYISISKFSSLAELENMPKQKVNILAIIKSVGQPLLFEAKNGKHYNKRELIIVDR